MKQNTISMNIGIEWYVRCIRNERQNGRQAKLIKRAVNIDTHRNHIIYYCVWLCMCVMLYFDFIFVADSLLSLIFYFVQFNRCFRCSQFFPNIFAIHLAKTVLHLQIKLELIVFFFFLLCLLLFSVSLLNRYRITANLLFILWIFCFDTMETIWLWQIYCVNNIFLEINLKYACVLNHYKQTINKNFTIGNYIGGSMSRNYTIKPILTNKELIK